MKCNNTFGIVLETMVHVSFNSINIYVNIYRIIFMFIVVYCLLFKYVKTKKK